jgi:integrase
MYLDSGRMSLMAVYKDGKVWRADVYINAKRVIQKGGIATKKEAKFWHDKTATTYELPQEPVKEVLFEVVIARFEEFHLPKIAISTRRRYRQDIELRIRPMLGKVAIKDFNPIFLERISKKIFEKLAVKTANNCIGLLKTMCNRAVQWEMMDGSLIKHLQMRKESRKPYTWWDKKEDIMKFLTVAKGDPYELAYRLGLECGMRLGEVVGLTKSAIDLKNCQIHVHRQWLVNEKVYGPPKHGKSRYIRFERDSELYRLIEKAVSENPKEDRIFLRKGGDLVSCNILSQVYFQALVEKSGAPKIRFHDLRHTFASWYMMVSDDVWQLKAILGHADIQTTQKYAHLSPGGCGVPEIFKMAE